MIFDLYTISEADFFNNKYKIIYYEKQSNNYKVLSIGNNEYSFSWYGDNPDYPFILILESQKLVLIGIYCTVIIIDVNFNKPCFEFKFDDALFDIFIRDNDFYIFTEMEFMRYCGINKRVIQREYFINIIADYLIHNRLLHIKDIEGQEWDVKIESNVSQQ